MELSKENIDKLRALPSTNLLCNKKMLEMFLLQLENVEFMNIDVEKSIICIADSNGEILEEDYKQINKVFPTTGHSYLFSLESKRNKNIKLNFYLWNFEIDISIGSSLYSYADGVTLKTDAEIFEFKRQLSILFKSSVAEELTYNKGRLKKTSFTFYLEDGSNIVLEKKRGMFFCRSKNEEIVLKRYKPWMS